MHLFDVGPPRVGGLSLSARGSAAAAAASAAKKEKEKSDDDEGFLSVVELEASAPAPRSLLLLPAPSPPPRLSVDVSSSVSAAEESVEEDPERPRGWRAPTSTTLTTPTTTMSERLGAPPAASSLFVGCLSPTSASGNRSSSGVCSVPLQVALLVPGRHEVGEGARASWEAGTEGGGERGEALLLPQAKLIVEA